MVRGNWNALVREEWSVAKGQVQCCAVALVDRFS